MVRIFGRKKQVEGGKGGTATAGLAMPKVQISVSQTEADKTRRELRLLEVEKDIAQYALVKIYEAEAGGTISEAERNSMAERYKAQMKSIEERMLRSQMLVTLRELETGQSELIKLFNEKFTELEGRIQEIRGKLGYGVAATPELARKVPPTPEAEGAAHRRPAKERPAKAQGEAARAPQKTEAEMEIERLQNEIQKALEKLEQIELEI